MHPAGLNFSQKNSGKTKNDKLTGFQLYQDSPGFQSVIAIH